MIARMPGRIISLSADWVTISIHLLESGLALPSMRPLIFLNCLRTSSTTAYAAFPTAFMVSAENRKTTIPPRNNPTMTSGEVMSITVFTPVNCSATCVKDANSANAVNPAEPMAKPFPMAAVVLPTASRSSVRFLIFPPKPAISEMPAALSATGP